MSRREALTEEPESNTRGVLLQERGGGGRLKIPVSERVLGQRGKKVTFLQQLKKASLMQHLKENHMDYEESLTKKKKKKTTQA